MNQLEPSGRVNSPPQFKQWPTGGERLIDKYGLALVLIIFTLLALLYDFTVPFFEKPDELKHFAMIQFIQTQHKLPVVKEGVYRPWDQEGTQPPLYHILAGLATAWFNLHDFEEPPRNPHYADERSFIWRERGNNNLYLHGVGESWRLTSISLAVHVARWVSLLAGLGTISLTYRLAQIIFVEPDSPPRRAPTPESENRRWTFFNRLPLLAAASIAFVPQFLHVSSAITNDSLSVTLAAAGLVLLALLIKNGGSTRLAVALGLLLGLGALTKLSLLYLLPLTGVALLFDFSRHRSWRRLLGHGLIIGGGTLLLSGWWYGRNWQVYGDPTALNAHLLYRGGALDPRPTLAQIWQTEMTGLELSFWGAFGAGQILFEPWVYHVLRWFEYLILFGVILGMWQRARLGLREKPTQLITLLLLILWSLIIFVALLRWMQITPASWGRLLFPALPALGVLTVWGLAQYGILISSRRTPSALRGGRVVSLLFPLMLVAMLFLLSLVSPFRYIRAAYAREPLLSPDKVPADIVPLDLVYDDALRLVGYTVDESSLHPGEWLPVTLYWQAERPLNKNYSAFVHLLDHQNTVVGQSNTYPAGGNWPTSLLEPGKILEDTHHVFILPGAETPTVLRLALGIFEFEDPHRTAKVAVNPEGETVAPMVGAIPLIPLAWPQLNPAQPKEANFAGQIQLVGFDGPTETEVEPGDTLPLTFYWQTLSPPGQNLNLFIHLVETTGAQVAGFDGPPVFPTIFWQAGNAIIDTRHLTLPADLPAGEYELQIGWYNLDTLARLPLIEGTGDTLSLLAVLVGEAGE